MPAPLEAGVSLRRDRRHGGVSRRQLCPVGAEPPDSHAKKHEQHCRNHKDRAEEQQRRDRQKAIGTDGQERFFLAQLAECEYSGVVYRVQNHRREQRFRAQKNDMKHYTADRHGHDLHRINVHQTKQK